MNIQETENYKRTQDQAGELFGPVISSYSREQAIEDGVLADVSTMAREAGFKFPVAITSRVHALMSKGDYEGRLWDLLWMCICEIRRGISGDKVYFTARMGNRNVNFWAVIGPGDTLDPVITIMFTDED